MNAKKPWYYDKQWNDYPKFVAWRTSTNYNHSNQRAQPILKDNTPKNKPKNKCCFIKRMFIKILKYFNM
jgi:hypothetical protein